MVDTSWRLAVFTVETLCLDGQYNVCGFPMRLTHRLWCGPRGQAGASWAGAKRKERQDEAEHLRSLKEIARWVSHGNS